MVSSGEELTDPTMARIAALSGAGSLAHAVTTRDRSRPNATVPEEAIGEGA